MRRGGSIAVCLTVILTGCAQYRTLAPAALLELGPEQIVQQAADRAGEIGPLRTTGTILIQGPLGAYSARGVMLYAGPDSLRFDVSITLGGVVVQGIITGRSFRIYLPTERTLMTGRIGEPDAPDPQGASHDRAVLLEMILGPALAYDPVELAARATHFDVSADHAVIGVDQSDGTRLQLTVGPELEYLKSVRINRLGEVYLEITYRNYRNIRGARLPQYVVLSYPREEFELVLEVVSRSRNPEYTTDDFILELPAVISRIPFYSLIPPALPR